MVVIPTVTGPLAPEAVGIVDGHAHAWIDPPPEAAERLELRDEDAITSELQAFREAGGALLVDCQPGGCGRDAARLHRISERSGVGITITTGFHLQRYYPPDAPLWSASRELAAEHFLRELRDRVEEAPTRAATIKVGYEGTLEGQALELMEGAAQAARESGAPLLFHTEQGRNVEALLPFFAERGVPPGRLYLCHLDKRPDPGLHLELARAGALLGYDTFVRPKYKPEQGAWTLLEQLAAAGLGRQVAIGLDLALTSMWRHGGGPGPAAAMEKISAGLRERGFDTDTIRDLQGRNIARYLVCAAEEG